MSEIGKHPAELNDAGDEHAVRWEFEYGHSDDEPHAHSAPPVSPELGTGLTGSV